MNFSLLLRGQTLTLIIFIVDLIIETISKLFPILKIIQIIS
jgi:hypothetical protein